MSKKVLVKILKSHYIPFYENNGRVIADTMSGNKKLFQETMDVTDFTLKQLRNWLGY